MDKWFEIVDEEQPCGAVSDQIRIGEDSPLDWEWAAGQIAHDSMHEG